MHMLDRFFNFRLVTTCVLVLFLIITPMARAGYVPPPNQKRAGDYTKSSGPRDGCEDKLPIAILAPKNYIGLTTSRYPTFVWFASNPDKVEFSLFEFDASGKPSKQIGEPITLRSQKIMQYSLPENQPGLSFGQKYLWQVAIACPQGDLIKRAEFIVVEMPSTLSKKLATASYGAEKVNLYAEAGLWYDALKEAFNLDKNKQSVSVSSLLQDLAKAEEPEATQKLTSIERQEIQKHIEKLKQIATSLP